MTVAVTVPHATRDEHRAVQARARPVRTETLAPIRSKRPVLLVSGQTACGPRNLGRTVARKRDHAAERRVVLDGLALLPVSDDQALVRVREEPHHACEVCAEQTTDLLGDGLEDVLRPALGCHGDRDSAQRRLLFLGASSR